MADRRETVEYEGDRYHRYPDSDHHHLRDYYWAHTRNGEATVALHRQKWRDKHGDIPDGHIIHHCDDDPLNNDIDNLEAITRAEHAERHPDMGQTHSDAHLKKMLEGAAEWHQSDEGLEWHKEHYEEVKEELHKKRYTHECIVCEDEYQSNREEQTKFCSDSCRQKHQYRTKREIRECPVCGDEYDTYEHSDTTYCSISCANRDR